MPLLSYYLAALSNLILILAIVTTYHYRVTLISMLSYFFFQAEDGIRDYKVTGVQTCALPISLVRADDAGGRQHRHVENAGRRRAVGERVVAARVQRGLAWHRRDAVRGEHLCAQDLRGQVAHAARRAVREAVAQAHVPRVCEARVRDVDDELAPCAEIHGRRAGLGQAQLGRRDRQRRRDAVLAGQRLVEDAVDEAAEIPAGRVDELQPVHVRRVVVEDDRQVDDDLLAGRDDGPGGAELEAKEPAHVRERVVHAIDERRAGALPADRVADVCKLRGRLVEVVGHGDAVQVVERALVADDRAGYRVPHHRHRERVGEGHADGRRGRAGRVQI